MTHDEIREAPPAEPRRSRDVTRVPHVVRLHSRPHIDLLRTAGALCCS
ncbi:putative leader peptide [Streptomyces glaucus]